MKPTPIALLARCALVSTLLLTLVTPAFAANFYATPAGAGSQNGSSFANAYPQSQIQSATDALQPGDTLNLGSGTYTITSLSITGSGTAGNLKTILGVDTGGGAPLFQGTFNVNGSANGATFISFPGAASYWMLKNIQFRNQPFVIDMPQNGTTDTLRTNITFDGLAFDSIEDGIRIRNANNILVKNCTAIRYTKKAFRTGRYSSFITYQSCSADCNGGDDTFPANAIPTGFSCDPNDLPETVPFIHDIRFEDCVARNNRYTQSSSSYWNGDGFTSERDAYNITFLRCKSYDNHDGGFDNKATDVVYQDCVSAGNGRGFRHWGPGGQMVNCVSAFNFKWGGTGASYALGVISGTGALTVDFSTFHESNSMVYVQEPTGSATVNDSILSTTSATSAFTDGAVTLNNTATYRPGSGTNPNYVAALSTWRGTPLNAMDSQTYGVTKGYNSTQVTGGDTTPPSVPTGLAANSISSSSFNLSWTASTDNVAVTGYEVFRNGVSYAMPTSTSVSVTGLAASTTYAMRVRARDAAGNWSAQSTTLNVTTAAAGGAIRIESGSNSSYTDVGGNVWGADHSFTGGSIVDRGAIAIANTNHDRIYQTERWGLTGYAIAVPNGTYTVNLHFAETFTGITAAGQRVFSVTAEGASPAGWSNIDLFAEAGGLSIALIKTASVAVSDGVLNLAFAASVNNAIINGIAVIPAGGDTTPPSVPTGLASSNITSSSFTLSWTASTDNVGVTGYEVFRNGVSIATPSGTNVSVTGLSASTTYSMTVRARDAAANWSAQSAALNVTTSPPPDTTPPSVPTGLASSNITSNSFTLSWTASTDNVGVTGYEVFRNGVSIATPSGTSVSVTGLSASTTYSMTVRARDAAANWSAQSTAFAVTTTGVISVNLGDGANVLAAGEVAGAMAAANWNNSTTSNQVLTDVVNNSGAATTADITFGGTSFFYANNTAGTTGDVKMMRSQRAQSNSSTMSATAAQVPYALYDVYVYWGGRVASEPVPLTMTVNFQLFTGGAWVTNETKYIRDDNRVWDGTYNESTATTAAAALDGNEYVVFRNVTAATFRISATSGVRTGICGLQIIQR